MPTLSVVAMAMLESDELSRHDIHLAMIFLAIIAIAMVAQAVGLLVTSAFAAKLLHRVDGIANQVEQRTGPLLDKTHALVTDIAPKIHAMTTNVEQMSYTVRAKVDEMGETVSQLSRTVNDANDRTRAQVARVDGIVTQAVTATAEISGAVQEGIKGPVRQMVGLLAGLRAGLETLIERSPFGRG